MATPRSAPNRHPRSAADDPGDEGGLTVLSIRTHFASQTSPPLFAQLPAPRRTPFSHSLDPKPTLSSRIDGHARDEGFSPAGAGPLRRAASSAAIARLSARPSAATLTAKRSARLRRPTTFITRPLGGFGRSNRRPLTTTLHESRKSVQDSPLRDAIPRRVFFGEAKPQKHKTRRRTAGSVSRQAGNIKSLSNSDIPCVPVLRRVARSPKEELCLKSTAYPAT